MRTKCEPSRNFFFGFDDLDFDPNRILRHKETILRNTGELFLRSSGFMSKVDPDFDECDSIAKKNV